MIQILMPIYNGEKYLKQQIDSILSQTYTEWHLTFRDDNSSDNSKFIVDYYCKLFPNKFSCLNEPKSNLGPTKAFEFLLYNSKGEYLMLSDQDDIWPPTKLELSINEIQRLEYQEKGKPCLVCTDAKCMDSEGNIIENSFFKSQKFFSDVIGDECKMLALNVVQGSTIIINRQALKYILPIPKEQFHDKWIAVIISHFGLVSYLHIPTLLYRQHSHNVVGANNIGIKYFIRKLLQLPMQISLSIALYRELPFRPNVIKWIFYKIWFVIKRLF